MLTLTVCQWTTNLTALFMSLEILRVLLRTTLQPFFPMKGNLIQIAGMFSVSLVLLGSLGFAVKVLINLFTDQRGKPFF